MIPLRRTGSPGRGAQSRLVKRLAGKAMSRRSGGGTNGSDGKADEPASGAGTGKNQRRQDFTSPPRDRYQLRFRLSKISAYRSRLTDDHQDDEGPRYRVMHILFVHQNYPAQFGHIA